MQTSLRKMGNSTGMIVPRALLDRLGLSTGAPIDLRVEEGRLIAEPIVERDRAGWALRAAEIAEPTQEEATWLAFGNDGDDALTW